MAKGNSTIRDIILKTLNEEQYSKAPEPVRRMYISATEKIPLSQEEMRATMNAYPEYFTVVDNRTPSQKLKRLFTLKEAKRSFDKKIERKKRRGSKVMWVRKEDVEFPGEAEKIQREDTPQRTGTLRGTGTLEGRKKGGGDGT